MYLTNAIGNTFRLSGGGGSSADISGECAEGGTFELLIVESVQETGWRPSLSVCNFSSTLDLDGDRIAQNSDSREQPQQHLYRGCLSRY